MLVTHLPEVSARQVVDVYRRRWSVARLFKALKGTTGWGQHQVTKDPQRIERSIAISIMAYLMLPKFRAQDIPKHGSWSAFTLKRNVTWQLAQAECVNEHETPACRNDCSEALLSASAP
jgi:Transposase DDE domain